jgi:hypothetical protein
MLDWYITLFFSLAFFCLAHGKHSEECVNSNLPSISPWETEALTLWTADMLVPRESKDLFSFSSSTERKKVSALPSLFSRKEEPVEPSVEAFCAGRVSHLAGPSAEAIVHSTTEAAISNTTAFGASSVTSKESSGAVFVVANGANEGHWFSYHPGCLGTLTRVAADVIAPKRSTRRSLYLYTIAGRPVGSSPETVERGQRMLQLLIEGEAWVWGGVAPGFAFRIGIQSGVDNNSRSISVVLRTLSLTPRVLQVVDVIDNVTIGEVLESGKARMIRSPEVCRLCICC